MLTTIKKLKIGSTKEEKRLDGMIISIIMRSLRISLPEFLMMKLLNQIKMMSSHYEKKQKKLGMRLGI
jgi:hypothetical protein